MSFYKKNIPKALIFFGALCCVRLALCTQEIVLSHVDPRVGRHQYDPIPLSGFSQLDDQEVAALITLVADPRIRLFLSMVSLAEGTSSTKEISAGRVPLSDYTICFTGTRFDSFECHPGIKHVGRAAKDGLKIRSTASGRYQFLLRTWQSSRDRFGENVSKRFITSLRKVHRVRGRLYQDDSYFKRPGDLCREEFNPFLQDLCALYLLYISGALHDALQGNVKLVLAKVAPTWAALPEDARSLSYYNEHDAAVPYGRICSEYEKKYNSILLEKKLLIEGNAAARVLKVKRKGRGCHAS